MYEPIEIQQENARFEEKKSNPQNADHTQDQDGERYEDIDELRKQKDEEENSKYEPVDHSGESRLDSQYQPLETEDANADSDYMEPQPTVVRRSKSGRANLNVSKARK